MNRKEQISNLIATNKSLLRTTQERVDEINGNINDINTHLNIPEYVLLREYKELTQKLNPRLDEIKEIPKKKEKLDIKLKELNMTLKELIDSHNDLVRQKQELKIVLKDQKEYYERVLSQIQNFESELKEEIKKEYVIETETNIKKASENITKEIEQKGNKIPITVLTMKERDNVRKDINKVIKMYRKSDSKDKYVEFHDSIYSKLVSLTNKIQILTRSKPYYTQTLILRELDLITQGLVNGYLHYENKNFVLQELEKLYHDISQVPDPSSSEGVASTSAVSLFSSINRSTDSSGSGSQPFLGGKDTPSIQTDITLQTTPTIQTGGGSGMSSVPPSNQVDNSLRIRYFINGINYAAGIGEIIVVP